MLIDLTVKLNDHAVIQTVVENNTLKRKSVMTDTCADEGQRVQREKRRAAGRAFRRFVGHGRGGVQQVFPLYEDETGIQNELSST
jgi:hypothetical protein